MSVATALSIAGSDPSGGAGIQADLKAFSARGVYGMAAITALTAQNTQGVTGVIAVPPDFVAEQIRAVLEDIRVDAVKIGMIANAEIAGAVAEALSGYHGAVVLDPVMIAKGGHALLSEDAVSTLRDRLLPRATLLTPNLPEAAALLGAEPAATRSAMQEQAMALLGLGPGAVFLKGGHLSSGQSPDLLVAGTRSLWFEGDRIETKNTHGTGCSISSAIAAELAKGLPLAGAVEAAKAWLGGAIAAADSLEIGHGHGPTHHFHALWPKA
ncbi:bifunctional hydroxymethylpyrimidine kinase/phosphomethylpyrimidine kinase [Tropicimonas sp. IMCC6043]|uniref:bifunctional hydroxymethylpyrimidine kinase/phosphomethylpyrimidine kinase n=1 Tax=Tropicimonas sp. IMCC6043 TaxID=2510645 RepID=UPI00101C7D07|nr:bifunctional hydroxymethylpyrimidine kinase/phosphomethylpyrimidine kinase [Tropicimonas sp. IMCC6043]RYH11671.1 bifunctional hydroxymethylpyrimidine kinase/phosphomethylpyrimidine kinase [Tropicimonas sp. IMCC6043]